ncbi:MAG: ribonuclease III [bacterium]
MKDISTLAEKLGVEFENLESLKQALVHRSYLNEHPDFSLSHNERLEFLGDAVLELVVTEFLFTSYPNPEGELTNWRAALVNYVACASIAEELGIEEYLFLSRGESKDAKTKARQVILANAFEAVIGAIYMDKGYAASKRFIEKHVLVKLPYILEHKLFMDSKSRFQEAAQEKVGVTPSYRVMEESGPDHAKTFVVGIFLGKELVAEGRGTSKQEAEMAAAEKGLEVKSW